MKLYHAAASPFVRKVMMVLHETGQRDDVEIATISTAPTAPDASVAAANPLMKIPALERPDGVTLNDNRVICAFLNDRAGGKLYGSETGKWDMLALEATADGLMDAAVALSYESRLRPEDKQWDGWKDAQWSKVASACAALNTRWMSHLSGPLNIGQIAEAAALGYVDFRHAARGWRAGCDTLADWFETFSKRESFQATQPD